MWTSDSLLAWLVENQFLDETRAGELRAITPSPADAQLLAREMLKRDWLTPFQANLILTGKGSQLIVGPYRLLQRIGEGAMGQVYRAWNVRLHRQVALKTILKQHVASAKALERFRREMEAAAKLDHPNIVHVRDADEIDGRPFMAMDFVKGEILSTLVKTKGPLPVHVAADFARQAALGLQHAYERGIVHRDVKPGNLILAEGSSTVQLLDFGLARLEADQAPSDGRLTQLGNILGTIDYIAPEQAEDARLADTRSDIFSLGCTLYFLLTGLPPFPGETPVEKVASRITGDTPNACIVRAEVPAGLNAVLQKMMARQKEDRYQTPLEVAQALAPFTTPGASAPTVANGNASTSPAPNKPKTGVRLPPPAASAPANPPSAPPSSPPTAPIALVAMPVAPAAPPTPSDPVAPASPAASPPRVSPAVAPTFEPTNDPPAAPRIESPAIGAGEQPEQLRPAKEEFEDLPWLSVDSLRGRGADSTNAETIESDNLVFGAASERAEVGEDVGFAPADEGIPEGGFAPADDDEGFRPASNAAAKERKHAKHGPRQGRAKGSVTEGIPKIYLILAGVGAAIAFVLITIGILFSALGGGDANNGKKGYPPDAAITFLGAEFSTPIIAPGNRKFILVYIKRHKFNGPVKLTVEDLPEGVSAGTETLRPNIDKTQLPIVVPFGNPEVEKQIRIVAVSENLRAEKALNLVVREKKRK